MVATSSSPPENCDVFVVGAGLAGLAAAISFAREGFSVVSCGGVDRLGAGRTVALMGGSVDYLGALGVWDDIEAQAAPLRSLRIIDDTGSLFAARPLEFQSSEIDRDAFGWNIPNAALADTLEKALAGLPNVQRVDEKVRRFAFAPDGAEIVAEGGRTFRAALVVGADGRGSPARQAAGIAVHARRYDQSALTVFLAHSRPHREASTEFHTRQGPFTLVPLPGSAQSPHRSSLVWLMSEAEGRRRAALDDEALVGEIEQQANGLLGAMRIEGGRGGFPMSRQWVGRLAATRLALVGDAAHAFPPIGAQGLNLGLRDVDALVRTAVEARAKDADIGGDAALGRYSSMRGADIAMRMLAVNGLNMSLLADFGPIDALRGLGLTALRTLGPLRRRVMREGVEPFLAR